jgi:hypothetical protein
MNLSKIDWEKIANDLNDKIDDKSMTITIPKNHANSDLIDSLAYSLRGKFIGKPFMEYNRETAVIEESSKCSHKWVGDSFFNSRNVYYNCSVCGVKKEDHDAT